MSYIELPPLLNGFSFGMVMMALSSFLVLVHKVFFRKGPLDDIPGPFLARWTHVWLAYQVRMGRRYLVVDALHKVTSTTLVSMATLTICMLARNTAP